MMHMQRKWTALIMASWRGYIDVVNLLLNAGADFNVANEVGALEE